MFSDFRRTFQPTVDEQIEQYERLLSLHNEQIGCCSTCTHYKPSQMPGFVEDHGECDLTLPYFAMKVISHKNTECLYYVENIAKIEILKQKIEKLKGEKKHVLAEEKT